MRKLQLEFFDLRLEMDESEGVPHFLVRVELEWIEVLSHSALEDEGSLRDDGNGSSEGAQPD